jgi:hypothetical protein
MSFQSRWAEPLLKYFFSNLLFSSKSPSRVYIKERDNLASEMDNQDKMCML